MIKFLLRRNFFKCVRKEEVKTWKGSKKYSIQRLNMCNEQSLQAIYAMVGEVRYLRQQFIDVRSGHINRLLTSVSPKSSSSSTLARVF